MDIRTHLLIGKKIFYSIDNPHKSILMRKNFLYGTIKPDMISKYKFRRHYREESYDEILKKIDTLSKLKWSDINTNLRLCSFNQELGVVCHFICDFFCVPHNERWEFKNNMKEHLNYEKNLHITAKTYLFKDKFNLKLNPKASLEDFLSSLYINYLQDNSLDTYTKDLQYSYVVCYMVVSAILDNIFRSYTC